MVDTMPRVLAVIPARGGSKGIPGKNLRRVLGRQLVSWTIRQALNSALISDICLSSDHPGIVQVAEGEGLDVPFIRPSWLAEDDSLTSDVIVHALDFYAKSGKNFDYVTLLEPTSPLRKRYDLDLALGLLFDNSDSHDAVVSVAQFRDHPQIAMRIQDNGLLTPYFEAEWKPTRRQDLDRAYFPFVVIHASKVETFREFRTFYQSRTLPYVLEPWQAHEVDEVDDLIRVEAMMRSYGVDGV